MSKVKKKFYGIKKGKDGARGIFEQSWEEVSEKVVGVQGAIYKSFSTEEEAINWLYDIEENVHIDNNTLIAYVDGSSSATIEEYGSGVVLIFPNEEIEEISFCGNNEEAKSMKNVAGELSASMRAMLEAKKRGFANLIIYHDYEGVARWITGDWDAKKPMTKKYKEWYEKSIKGKVNVSFEWVKGHNNNRYNERADILAKQSIGL